MKLPDPDTARNRRLQEVPERLNHRRKQRMPGQERERKLVSTVFLLIGLRDSLLKLFCGGLVLVDCPRISSYLNIRSLCLNRVWKNPVGPYPLDRFAWYMTIVTGARD